MKDFEPYIIVFCCHNSRYDEAQGVEYASGKPIDFSLDNAERLEYRPNVKVIEMPCGGKTEVVYLMKAFESGADGVCVITCPDGECRFLEGNFRAQRRVKYTRKLLDEVGIEGDRIQIYQLPTSEKAEFKRVIDGMIEQIKQIGASPIGKN